MNMSASKEDVQILEARIKVLHNKIQQLNEHIDGLEGELEICLLTSRQMPVEVI